MFKKAARFGWKKHFNIPLKEATSVTKFKNGNRAYVPVCMECRTLLDSIGSRCQKCDRAAAVVNGFKFFGEDVFQQYLRSHWRPQSKRKTNPVFKIKAVVAVRGGNRIIPLGEWFKPATKAAYDIVEDPDVYRAFRKKMEVIASESPIIRVLAVGGSKRKSVELDVTKFLLTTKNKTEG